MRIVFAGTPQFSVPTLERLIESKHEVIAVYTQPDRPAGRGRKLTASPVKQVALKHNIPVLQPKSLRDADAQAELATFKPDVMIVIAYGLILPQVVLDLPRFGCINVHASLLPRWRGAAPIQRAIAAGDDTSGVTIMQLDEGLDTGAMLLKRECRIAVDDTSADLHDTLAEVGAEALLETLDLLEANALQPEAQNEALATYAHKLDKQEAKINWHDRAKDIVNVVRAFVPWPVSFTHFAEQPLRIWQATVLNESVAHTPGTLCAINKDSLDVATGEGVVRILKLQLPGGRVMSAQEFLNAHREGLEVGKTLFS